MEKAFDVMKPVKSMLGTSANELIEQRMNARQACFALLGALSAMSPNGRDYIGFPEDMKRDRAVHVARISAVDALANALMDEALDIQNRFCL